MAIDRSASASFYTTSTRRATEHAPNIQRIATEPDVAGIPVLPLRLADISQATLKRIAAPDWIYPAEWLYRGTGNLFKSANYLFQDIGTFKRVWVVGSQPFVCAPLDDNPSLERYEALAVSDGMPTNPTKGVEFLKLRDGTISLTDRRKKDPSLVSAKDLGQLANILIVYPLNFDVSAAGSYLVDNARQPPKRFATLVVLAKPTSLSEIIDLLTEADIDQKLHDKSLLMHQMDIRK